MKRYLCWGTLLLTALFLIGCVYQHSRKPNADLTYESWQKQVDTNPSGWTRGSSSWFTEGVAPTVDQLNNRMPMNAAMSTMMVRVPDSFTNIKVNGHFQVQIFGTSDTNSVYLYGPNAAVREVNVRVTKDTLYLEQSKDAPGNMDCVIIRVGIRNLKNLNQMGTGRIEGRLIRSSDLCVSSSGSGNIYLGGAFNVTRIISTGRGSISLFGAITPVLDITTAGSGSVNVSGNVGIRSITHHGYGDVNIVGANSDGLTVHADGKGKIGVNGRVAINEIDARDRTCVYIYYVNGDMLRAYATDHARIGLAGCTKNLYVDAGKGSRFDGHYLYTYDAYVRAHDAAHINVNGANKVFAAATENSSVYFFGSPNILTQFFRENGVVLPILTDKPRNARNYCPYYKRRHSTYKGEL